MVDLQCYAYVTLYMFQVQHRFMATHISTLYQTLPMEDVYVGMPQLSAPFHSHLINADDTPAFHTTPDESVSVLE